MSETICEDQIIYWDQELFAELWQVIATFVGIQYSVPIWNDETVDIKTKIQFRPPALSYTSRALYKKLSGTLLLINIQTPITNVYYIGSYMLYHGLHQRFYMCTDQTTIFSKRYNLGQQHGYQYKYHWSSSSSCRFYCVITVDCFDIVNSSVNSIKAILFNKAYLPTRIMNYKSLTNGFDKIIASRLAKDWHLFTAEFIKNIDQSPRIIMQPGMPQNKPFPSTFNINEWIIHKANGSPYLYTYPVNYDMLCKQDLTDPSKIISTFVD